MTKRQAIKKMKTPPSAAVDLAQSIFEGLAMIETMRPSLYSIYYDSAIEIGADLPAKENCSDDEVIEAVCNMGEDKINEWNAINDAKFPEFGFTAKPGRCPLLTMETMVMNLQEEMCKIMFEFLSNLGVMGDVKWEQIYGRTHYFRFREIQMRMLSNYVDRDLRKYLPKKTWTK